MTIINGLYSLKHL